MQRVKRTRNELRELGLPTLEDRMIALEAAFVEILKQVSGVPQAAKTSFENQQLRMNQADLDHPKTRKKS